MPPLPPLPADFAAALDLIDEAHAEDPRRTAAAAAATAEGGEDAPYELHYARQMTRWLARRQPDASPALQLACRAQHFRRWENPRDTFPPTRAGYLTWRSKQKAQAASQVSSLLLAAAIPPADVERVAALIRKEGLAAADPETQALEDAACLVFLDGELARFEREKGGELGEEKMLGILRKTWAKMSPEGRRLALEMRMDEGARKLVERALEE